MANNRMYLVNKRTGHRIYIAKYYPSTGWYTTRAVDEMNAVFDEADFGHLSIAERAAKRIDFPFGAPFSAAGLLGDEWVLEYECVTDPREP